MFFSSMAPLHKAASEGHAVACSILLQYGANINLLINNRCPLHYAAERGHLDVVHVLVKFKADLDIVDAQQLTPLALSIDNSFSEVAVALIQAGASLNILFKTSERDDGMLERDRAPLHVAVLRRSVAVLQACLAANADPNVATPDYYITPLHYAAKINEPLLASLLIDAGANIDAGDQIGNTPLHYAAYDNRMEIVRVLLDAGAISDKKNNEGKTPADLAIKFRHRDLLYMINTASYTQPLKDAIEALQDQIEDVSQENTYLQKEVEAGRQCRDALETVVYTLMNDVHKYYNEFRQCQGRESLQNLNEDFVARVREAITQNEAKKQTEMQNVEIAAQNHGMPTRKVNSNAVASANKLRAMITNNTALAMDMLSKNDFCESIAEYLPEFLLESIKLDNDEISLAIIRSKYTRVNAITKTQLNDTPLHLAVKLEKHALISALVSRGAYINKKNIAGQTPASLYSGLVVRKRGIPGVRNLKDLAPQDNLSAPDLPVCLFCNVNPPALQLLPCGHRPVCQSCFVKKRPTQCPRDACRKNFSGYKLIEHISPAPVGKLGGMSNPSTPNPATPSSPVFSPQSTHGLDVNASCSTSIFTSCVRQATSLGISRNTAASTSSNDFVDLSLSRTRSPSSTSTSSSQHNVPQRSRPPMCVGLPPKQTTLAPVPPPIPPPIPQNTSPRIHDSEEDRMSFSSKHSSESGTRLTLDKESALDFVMPKYNKKAQNQPEFSRTCLASPDADPEVSTIRMDSISSTSESQSGSNGTTKSPSESSSNMKMASAAAPKGRPPMDFSMPRYVPPAKK